MAPEPGPDESPEPEFHLVEDGEAPDDAPRAQLLESSAAALPLGPSPRLPLERPRDLSGAEPAGPWVVYARGLALRRDVTGLDLRLPRGAVSALVGPRGAGKTTLLQLLLGIERPRAGQALVLGVDPRRHPTRVRGLVGYVPARSAAYGWMTPAGLGRFLAGLYRGWDAKRFRWQVRRLGIPSEARVDELSQVERALLSLAGALAPDPALLLVDVADELDLLERHRLLDALADEVGRRSLVVATSRAADVAGAGPLPAAQLVVLDQGSRRFAGSPQELRAGVRRLTTDGDGPPGLPADVRPLSWRQPRGARPGALTVWADAPQALAALAGAAGVAGVEPLDLDAAVLALVGGAP